MSSVNLSPMSSVHTNSTRLGFIYHLLPGARWSTRLPQVDWENPVGVCASVSFIEAFRFYGVDKFSNPNPDSPHQPSPDRPHRRTSASERRMPGSADPRERRKDRSVVRPDQPVADRMTIFSQPLLPSQIRRNSNSNSSSSLRPRCSTTTWVRWPCSPFSSRNS